MELAKRCEELERETQENDRVIARMERKLKDKVSKEFIAEYLNDPSTARAKLNQEMGGIRVGPRTKEHLDSAVTAA